MALRLTLRTLLAYLDDTLQAGEIKEIGQKVTESDAAQELIARIKQVTRRRRLTVPPTHGPNGMDPNDVSEYLDNVLSGDHISEVEKQALESDVHLAEIAACHQILTLVLGEPALVPPKAKERMYTIVQGRVTAPARKAEKLAVAATPRDDEASLALSMGWLRWVLPVAGVLLVAALGLAIYQILPSRQRQVAVVPDPRPPVPESPETLKPPKEEGKGTEPDKTKDKEPDRPKDKEPDKTKEVEKDPRRPVEIERSAPPSKDRVNAGTSSAYTGLPHAVVTRAGEKGPWELVRPNTGIFTHDTYAALPGFVGVLRTKTGVGVLLRGHLRDFTLVQPMETLMESAVVLHANNKFDLDLTLLRGRIFLTNQKESGACKIRLRFESEVWDVALSNKGDEIAVDLSRAYSPVINFRKGEAPRAHCVLFVLRGDASLTANGYETHSMEAEPRKWVRLEYDSFTKMRDPIKEASVPPITSKQPPDPALYPENARAGLGKMKAALDDLQTLFSTNKLPAIALKETLEKTDPASRRLAIYCLEALDEIGTLVDVLGDGDITHWPDREAAYFSLQRWVSRASPEQVKLLYDEENKARNGILIDKGFKKVDASRFLTLLHPFLVEDLGKVETYRDLAADLESSRIAIAEMAYYHLLGLSGGVKLPPGFNAAASIDERERFAGEVQKLIAKKLLPPAPPPPPAAPGPQAEKKE